MSSQRIVGTQKSLSYLRSHPGLLKHITFVVPESEVNSHLEEEYSSGLDVIGLSDSLHLERKRRLVVKNHLRLHDNPYLMMVDDDVSFQVWVESQQKFLSAKKNPNDWYEVLRSLVPEQLYSKDLHGATFAVPLFAGDSVKKNGFLRLDTVVGAVNYWKAEAAMKVFDTSDSANIWGIDNWMTLSFLVSGKHTATSYLATRGSDFKTPGGAGSYRSELDVQISFLRLMEQFPGLVFRKPSKPGDHVHCHDKILFKEAINFRANESKMRRVGEELFHQELRRAKLTEPNYQRLKALQMENGPLSRQPAESYIALTGDSS